MDGNVVGVGVLEISEGRWVARTQLCWVMMVRLTLECFDEGLSSINQGCHRSTKKAESEAAFNGGVVFCERSRGEFTDNG